MTTAILQSSGRVLCAAFACLVLVACQGSETTAIDATVSPGVIAVCTDCGQIKGTELCCAEDAVLCSKCGLVEGSPGCCRIEKGTTDQVIICADCGQFKGTELCCVEGQVLCDKCGLVEGSPGCCRIE